jgi:hypothetical protein
MMRFMQVGDNFIAYWLVISCVANFHFTTLEEYYVGTMTLPVCNGITDGSVAIIGLTVFTGLIGGNNIWATPVYDISALQMRGLTILTVGQIFSCVVALVHTLLSINK